MSTIDKDELFQHLSEFLKNKGVVMQEGVYTRRVQKGCALMAEAANRSQTAFEKARAGVAKGLDQVRQVIHEKTAPAQPKPPPAAGPAPATAAPEEPAPRPKKTSAPSAAKPGRPGAGRKAVKPARKKSAK